MADPNTEGIEYAQTFSPDEFLGEIESIQMKYPLSKKQNNAVSSIIKNFKGMTELEKVQFISILTSLSTAGVNIAEMGTQFVREKLPELIEDDEEINKILTNAVAEGIHERSAAYKGIWDICMHEFTAQNDPKVFGSKKKYPITLAGLDVEGFHMINSANMAIYITKEGFALSPDLNAHLQTLLESMRQAERLHLKQNGRGYDDELTSYDDYNLCMKPGEVYIQLGSNPRDGMLIMSLAVSYISSSQRFEVYTDNASGAGYLSKADHKFILNSFKDDIIGVYNVSFLETTNTYICERADMTGDGKYIINPKIMLNAKQHMDKEYHTKQVHRGGRK